MEKQYLPYGNTVPCFFFVDAQQQQWFRVESALSNPTGIRACLNSITNCMTVQYTTDDDKWKEFQACIVKAKNIWAEIEPEQYKKWEQGFANPNPEQ